MPRLIDPEKRQWPRQMRKCARLWMRRAPVNRDAAFKAWRDGYSVREYASEVAVPPVGAALIGAHSKTRRR